MHPPKAERHDLVTLTHTVSRGSFPVATCEVGDGWLYLTRAMRGHPNFAALSSYVLPRLGVQVTRWQHHAGSPYTWYDFYVDILTCEVGETVWTTKDLYLDVVVVEGQRALTNDTDEYLEAVREGLLTAAEADFALTAMHALLNGLGECGYSMRAWLKRELALEMVF